MLFKLGIFLLFYKQERDFSSWWFQNKDYCFS